MAKTVSLNQIDERRREVLAEMNVLQARLAELQEESKKLEIAQEVFANLSIEANSERPNGHAPSQEKDAAEAKSAVETDVRRGAPRPEGIPTIYEMTVSVLQDAKKEGASHLTASQIADRIENKFWPGMEPRAVRPSFHRFAEKGRLKKKGVFFSLPE